MSELVKEIEEAEILMADVHCCGVGLLDKKHIFKIQATLQRARDAITKAQGELIALSEIQESVMGRPQTAKQLMDIHDILTYTPEEAPE